MINDYIENIVSADANVLKLAYERQEKLVKPPRALGTLEDLAIKICAIKSNIKPILSQKRILVFAGDNGVVEENVSCSPKSITYEQCINLTKGVTGCSSMAKYNGIDIEVYDVGVDFDFNKYYEENEFYKLNCNDKNKYPFISNRVIDKKISFGTKNLYKEDAMTYENCIKAIEIGMEAVKKAKSDRIDILGIGEMGIGNTTTSSAILSFFSKKNVRNLTGKGGGLLQTGFEKKLKIIEETVCKIRKQILKGMNITDNINDKDTSNNIVFAKAKTQNQGNYHTGHLDNRLNRVAHKKCDGSILFQKLDNNKIVEVMSKIGGYDIAAMCGAFIGAAYYKIPVIIDGFISVVAAMLASLINPKVIEYMFASHLSKEIGYIEAINIINNNMLQYDKKEIFELKPLFDLKMRLGEGSGCVIAMQIIDSALAMHNNMLTFDEVSINDEYLSEIRKDVY